MFSFISIFCGVSYTITAKGTYMSQQDDKYMVAGVDLSQVYNLAESHVAQCMRVVLDEYALDPDPQLVRDIYAYVLNQLPTLYPHSSAAVPDDPARAWAIHRAVEEALSHVLANPKR